METKELKKRIKLSCEAAFEAGQTILEVYDSDFEVENKADSSPLTEADKRAHLKITAFLKDTPHPILSEEGRTISYEERKDWDYFWMVDPLDGTKEFVKRNGEFTVNIALIHEQRAIMGVIYVPVKDELYFGGEGVGAFKISKFSTVNKASTLEEWMSIDHKLPFEHNRMYTIVGSRSHLSEETKDFIAAKEKELGEISMLSVGSSLKLCMVAEGKADVYPRFAPTMEWDTAAGQAIVEAVGGTVIDWKTKERMKYNRKNLLNNSFLVSN